MKIFWGLNHRSGQKYGALHALNLVKPVKFEIPVMGSSFGRQSDINEKLCGLQPPVSKKRNLIMKYDLLKYMTYNASHYFLTSGSIFPLSFLVSGLCLVAESSLPLTTSDGDPGTIASIACSKMAVSPAPHSSAARSSRL